MSKKHSRPKRQPKEAGHLKTAPEIIYEDNHLLVLNKPSGWVSQGAVPNANSALDFAKQLIKKRDRKPGNVYLGVVSRLDKSTSGVLLYGKTSKASSRISEQIRQRSVAKHYLAIVEGELQETTGTWTDVLRYDDNTKRSIQVRSVDSKQALASNVNAGEQVAVLHFHVLAITNGRSLVWVNLETGRKHQIRSQFAGRGFPVVGDSRYGASPNRSFAFASGSDSAIALHAWFLQIEHPTRKLPLALTTPTPDSWRELFPEIESLIGAMQKSSHESAAEIHDNSQSTASPRADLCRPIKIVSGGQTGVDRAALDVAIDLGLEHGGWCPRGRRAEDGPIDARYALKETVESDYATRTKRNVIDSDGTLILFANTLSGGSKLTSSFAFELGKPSLCISIRSGLFSPTEEVQRVLDWMDTHRIGVLNVAGPRASSSDQIYQAAYTFCRHLLENFSPSSTDRE